VPQIESDHEFADFADSVDQDHASKSTENTQQRDELLSLEKTLEKYQKRRKMTRVKNFSEMFLKDVAAASATAVNLPIGIKKAVMTHIIVSDAKNHQSQA